GMRAKRPAAKGMWIVRGFPVVALSSPLPRIGIRCRPHSGVAIGFAAGRAGVFAPARDHANSLDEVGVCRWDGPSSDGWIMNHPTPGGGVIGPASPVARCWASTLARPVGRPNPLIQSQAQPLSLWSPPAAGVLCLCPCQSALYPCRQARQPEEAEAVPDRPRVLVPPLQKSSPTVPLPPDKCPSGSEPRSSRQR